MTLIYVTLAWAFGTLLARQVVPSLYLLGGLSIVALIALGLCWRSEKRRLPAILAVAMLLGGWRYILSQPMIDEGHLAYYNDRDKVLVRGYVSAEPSVRATYTQLEIAAEEIALDGSWHKVRGKLVLNKAHYPAYEYGDLLCVSGVLETPPILDDFSYKEYLASRGIHSLMRRARIDDLSERRGSAFLKAIFRFKKELRGVIESILPGPDAGLLSGILLGLGHTLPGYLYKAFRTTGLTHIIVISGFNISLVSQAVILSSRRFLHRWVALCASLIAVGLFTIFVGPSPPVTRAALMGCVFIGGQLAGRRSHALTSLAFASLVMMICNPLLLWSVSFQLSFASTLALIVLEPFLVRHGYAWMERWAGSDRALRWTHIAESVLVATVAAQIATLPIIWHHFAEVSLLSLLANVLVLPVQPAIMLFGSIATALGALWQPAGQAAAWVVWPFLRYSIGVVELLAKWPLAALKVPRISATVVWAFYALVSVLLFSGDRPKVPAPAHGNGTKEQPLSIKVGLFVPALVALLIWAGASSLPDGKLHLYLLDVGQGDAILVRTPGGRTILVDGGPDPVLLTSRLGPAPPFWQRRIDLVVATHADQDHLAGLVPVIERYRVPLALEPPRMDDCPLSARWHAVLAEAHTEVVQASRGHGAPHDASHGGHR